jgi:hypothetical protein
MPEQPYTTENPPVREVTVESNTESVDAQVSPARPDYIIDGGDKVAVSEVTVQLDEQVGPQDPNAVIVPPEGRGVHPNLGIVGEPTPEQLLASGDAVEATGVSDGKVVTSSEAAKAEADDKS